MEVTPIPFTFETPTPLPTPFNGATAYRLKNWDEKSALELIQLAEQFAFADNIPMPFGEKRFNYQINQTAIQLAAREALIRFPDTGHKEELEWRVGLANTILNSSDSDEWILQEIESILNEGIADLANLDKILNLHGFEIGHRQPAPNLFGDGQSGQVVWIVRQDRGYTGLYAALRQLGVRKYELTKIYSSWDFNFGYDEPLKLGDHTGDGIPEVLLFPGYHNGSFCGYNLVIYQWQDNGFVDASQGQFSFDQCSYPESWEYGTLDRNGAQTIETLEVISFPPAVKQNKIYTWSGEHYELTSSRIVPPAKLDGNAAAWIPFAMNDGDYQTITEKIQQFLSKETQLEMMKAELGLSFPDYLRFQLGLAYAFQSEHLHARNLIEELRDNPQNPSVIALSNAAQAYLDNFTEATDLYQACQAALMSMNESLNHPPSNRHTSDYEKFILQKWGFIPSRPLDSTALCNLNRAFEEIVVKMDVSQFDSVRDELSKAGVLIRSAKTADLNGDGQEEWILLTDTPGDDAPVNLWILLRTSNGVRPLPIVSWQRKHFDLPRHEGTNPGMLNVKTTVTPDGRTLTFIHAANYLYVFTLDANKQTLDRKLWPIRSVENYRSYQRGNNLVLEITTSDNFCRSCKDNYIWLNDHFIHSDLVFPGLPEAEKALLIDSRPQEAKEQLREIISDSPSPETPYLMYLLGLASELSGDHNAAIQAYWSLWQEFPESIYALMSQAKLELRK